MILRLFWGPSFRTVLLLLNYSSCVVDLCCSLTGTWLYSSLHSASVMEDKEWNFQKGLKIAEEKEQWLAALFSLFTLEEMVEVCGTDGREVPWSSYVVACSPQDPTDCYKKSYNTFI